MNAQRSTSSVFILNVNISHGFFLMTHTYGLSLKCHEAQCVFSVADEWSGTIEFSYAMSRLIILNCSSLFIPYTHYAGIEG